MKKNLLLAVLFVSSFSFGQTVFYTEDFQSGIPSTWEFRNLDGQTPDATVSEYTDAYISKVDPADTTNVNLTASSTSFFSPVGTANRWLISPKITLGAYGNAIEWKAKSHDPSYPETYLVLISTTDSLEASFTDTVGYVVQELADWSTRSADLSALGLDNQSIYVAFILQTDDGFKFYLDDVSLSKDDPASLYENKVEALSFSTLENGLYKINSTLNFDEIRVLDVMGRVVSSSTDKTIDIREENSGIYILQARKGNDLFVSKLLR